MGVEPNPRWDRLRGRLVRLERKQPGYYIANKKGIDTPLCLAIGQTTPDREFPVTRPSWSPTGPGLDEGPITIHTCDR